MEPNSSQSHLISLKNCLDMYFMIHPWVLSCVSEPYARYFLVYPFCTHRTTVPGRGRAELKGMFLIYHSSRQMKSNTFNNVKDNQLHQYCVVVGRLKIYVFFFSKTSNVYFFNTLSNFGSLMFHPVFYSFLTCRLYSFLVIKVKVVWPAISIQSLWITSSHLYEF